MEQGRGEKEAAEEVLTFFQLCYTKLLKRTGRSAPGLPPVRRRAVCFQNKEEKKWLLHWELR